MATWRKILSGRKPRTEAPQPEGCAQAGAEPNPQAEPVFSCDCSEQVGYFCLKRGKWAGKGIAKLHCCEDPLCGCGDVDFYCGVYDDSEHPHMLHFALDPTKQTIAPNHDKDRHEDSAELAEAMAAEFGDEEWRCLRQYLLTRKRKAIREMDVTKLAVPESPNVISDDGHMVPFGEIFPFGAGFEFELDGAHWLADDHYCHTQSGFPLPSYRNFKQNFGPSLGNLEQTQRGAARIPSPGFP